MKKNRVHFVVLCGLMAGTVFGAEIPAQAEKAQQKGRIAIEKEVWQKGLAAAKKRHWNGQQLTKKERDYYNALGKRLGITALLAAIGIGAGVARVKQQRRIRAEEDAAWAARQAVFEQQDALNLAYEQGQERDRRQQEIQRRFIDAVDKGYLAEAQRFLDSGAQINSSSALSKHRGNALWSAVEKGNSSMVDFLLKNGADVNANNGSALLVAVERGNLSMVDFLLKNGADVNAKRVVNGRTALMLAASRDDKAILDRLLAEKDIDINDVDTLGRTALIWAAQTNKPSIVQRLLEEGKINTALVEDYGKTAANIAREKGYNDIAQMIEEASKR